MYTRCINIYNYINALRAQPVCPDFGSYTVLPVTQFQGVHRLHRYTGCMVIHIHIHRLYIYTYYMIGVISSYVKMPEDGRTYCGTVIAMSVCHVLSVSRSSYLLALEQYPSQKANQQLLAQQRSEAKDLRQAIQRRREELSEMKNAQDHHQEGHLAEIPRRSWKVMAFWPPFSWNALLESIEKHEL